MARECNFETIKVNYFNLNMLTFFTGNLPCIVGAKWATDKIKHGDIITLNADEGNIVKAA